MGNSFVLFDVSIVISHGQFHCGNRGYTQNTDFPWVKSHFPVGKRSSGTATYVALHVERCLLGRHDTNIYPVLSPVNSFNSL